MAKADPVRQWTLPKNAPGFSSLQAHSSSPLLCPPADDEVTVKLYAASLNYRDIMIAKGAAPGEVKSNVVPGSDGAGMVLAAGIKVTAFKAGDKVITHMCPFLPDDEAPTMTNISAGLGHTLDGTLRDCGNFHESSLVHAPSSLGFEEACTLTCSGLTAWNGLMGLRGRQVKAGDWVLVQGTGGVSIAALQFAVAGGASVVATTSTVEKAKRLEALGATHVINYRQVPTWGYAARKLTPDERGFDFIVDVGGNTTLPESLEAIRTNGIVVATGLLGVTDSQPVPMLAALLKACTIRGVLLGTRTQFREMVRFVEERKLVPVMDDAAFELHEVMKAYERLERQHHFSKVVIRIE